MWDWAVNWPSDVYVGIDLGLRKVAVSIPERGVLRSIELNRGDYTRAEELLKLQQFVTGVVPTAAIVSIEMPILGLSRNAQTAIGIGQTCGVVMASVAACSREIHDVAVSSWKKAVVGRGNATKDDVGDWLRTNHEALYRGCEGNQDLIDASCIAFFGTVVDEGLSYRPRPR